MLLFAEKTLSPKKHFLETDDVKSYATYILYWDSYGSVESDVKNIVAGKRKFLNLHLETLATVTRGIHNSIESAMRQLCLESRYTGDNGAYILCSNDSYDAVLNSCTSEQGTIEIIVNIAKAVNFDDYWAYQQGARAIEEIAVILPEEELNSSPLSSPTN